MPLDEYQAKRDFSTTPEPSGEASGTPSGALSFVVQKHAARALHYDFRLELDGVLMSWAIPKGPSLDPHDKRLAVHVEDHPIEYGGFEGTIPTGEYGAGTVIVWDRGTWEPLGDPHAGMTKGDFKFTLHGTKLQGLWVLVRLKPRPGEKRDNWLLIKERDEFVRSHDEYDVTVEMPDSVLAEDGAPEEASDPPGSAAPAPSTPTAAANPPATVPGVPAAQPVAAAFPSPIGLELCTLVDAPPASGEWLTEAKYDGYRVALALDGERRRALTRSGADWSERFAPLLKAAAGLPAQSAVIDGEAVVFDERGISRFELLQRALGEHPERIAYVAFDLLYLNGYDLRELPLLKRKELLRELLGDSAPDSPLRFADHMLEGADEFFRQACMSDLEGIVCKRPESRYIPGRGRDWVKIKCRNSQELVVGGFTEGEGSRAALGSVLVGTYDGSRLVYAGRVGSGFDEATLADVRARLDALEVTESPFAEPPHITGHVVHWTRPELVIEAAFREWTSEGVLRQPVFLGLREDKRAAEVVRERPDAVTAQAAAPRPAAAADPAPDAAPDAGAASEPSLAPPATATAPGEVLGIRITNPEKPLFPDSPGFPKLALAEYYAAVAPLMLAEIAERPLTLVRCPVGHGHDCFYQRHPDKGTPPLIKRFRHSIKHEEFDFLYITDAEGIVALAQMGVGEIHTWLARYEEPRRPDRICFDLDPGPDVHWAQIRSAAELVRDECAALGFRPYVKSTGSKGLHVVLPIEPVWEFERIRALSKAIVDRLVARHPNELVGTMAKSQRDGRIFFDYLRNAEGASAVAPYSTRMRQGPPCAVPLAWEELTDELDIRAFTPERVVERMHAGIDPWRDIDDAASGLKLLKAAEASLGE